jgi:antitoxin ParD1/3/4
MLIRRLRRFKDFICVNLRNLWIINPRFGESRLFTHQLKTFKGTHLHGRNFSTSIDDMRELIRKDQEGRCLRGLLRDGAASAPTAPVDEAYFAALRERIRFKASA